MSAKTADEKLLAEWFWIDRWTGSTAFALGMAARGLYREMLTQAWRRGARLPNNHESIRRYTGCTEREWRNLWPQIARFWRVDGEHLVNDTQLEVYAECLRLAEAASARGVAGAKARWGSKGTAQADAQASTQASARAVLEECSPDPDPKDKSDTRASRGSYRDPFGQRTDVNAAGHFRVGQTQLVSIPAGWWTKACREYGLSLNDVDAFAAACAAYVVRHGFEDGGKRLPWLDARLAEFRAARSTPNDGLRPASEFLDEQRRIAATLDAPTSPEERRALLRPVRSAPRG